MRRLTNAELLNAWETGLEQPMLDATLSLLATACSVNSTEEVGKLSIGDRDVKLLQQREWLFGRRLNNLAKCPNCNELVEWECDLNEFYLQPVLAERSSASHIFKSGGFTVRFRLPNTLDVIKAISSKGNSKTILSNCILEVLEENKKSSIDCLPDDTWVALNEKMSQLDPQADIRIVVNCPLCFHHWQTSFDIVSYLWAEISNWAQRMMQEIYLLAKAFGWAEKDILNMNNYRRRLYIEMLKG